MSKTYGEQFSEALACKSREEADAWFKAEVDQHNLDFGQTRADAEQAIRRNLGYMAGYYWPAEQDKIRELFDAPHPIFGNDAWPANPQKAFDAATKAADHNGLALTGTKPEVSG